MKNQTPLAPEAHRSPALAPAPCSYAGLESGILRVAQALEHNAQTRHAIAGDGLAFSELQQRCQSEAVVLLAAADILRRHVAATSERQPQTNTAIRHGEDGHTHSRET